MVTINILQKGVETPSGTSNTAYLHIDYWNDYSYVTMFYMTVADENGVARDIGHIKIGFAGQTTSVATHKALPEQFSQIPESFFSLGQGVEYYENLQQISPELREKLLAALNDMVFRPAYIDQALSEMVFKTSFLRDVSLSVIKGQYQRVLAGAPPLTDFKFAFSRSGQNAFSPVKLDFKVIAGSMPSTNIHAIIGRNGVGKTTLLNDMIFAVTHSNSTRGQFTKLDRWAGEEPISNDYFSSLVSVSFSAFDPFEPPKEQPDPSKGTCYFYIGIKDRNDHQRHRTIADLRRECADALCDCFRNPGKNNRWKAAIQKLGSDENFDSMNLVGLEQAYRKIRGQLKEQSDSREFRNQYFAHIDPYLRSMSSGHAIVLLTITKLVATVEEKTLVILDEPESHLHPPLLSAFVRALSDLLHDRNGVALIATHSPVVLQEIPRSCAWKINRVGAVIDIRRPEIETFGENVGVLTREIFTLEVSKSGFYSLLIQSVERGGSYDEILQEYHEQLGIEGRVILKSLVVNRDGGSTL